MTLELTAPVCAHPWIPDQGDGTYRNPIICADYSDPDVIRHGDDFWMTASSFTCAPGLPILHSRDLVNWTLVNHAIPVVPDPSYRAVRPGCGVWAPSIRHHAGRFWIFFAMPDEGIYMTTASDPRGAWTEPHLVQAGRGLIDPCPLWDDDGRAYLVHAYARSRAGFRDRLRVAPMATDGSRLLGEGQVVFDAPERQPVLEGPKFLKKDGWYYLLAPAGGVSTGWEVILRSRNIYGPYDDRVILEQGGTAINGPHQGALVDLPNGDWWFLHFQDLGVYGRVLHLQPGRWENDWLQLGEDLDGSGIGKPVAGGRKPDLPVQPVSAPATGDEFDGPALSLAWQWQANPEPGWASLAERRSFLRLRARPVGGENLYFAPHLLLQKFPARTFTVTTKVDPSRLAPGDTAGLIVLGDDYAWIGVRWDEEPRLVCNVVKSASSEPVYRGTALARRPMRSLWLRVMVDDGGLCRFAHSADGRRFELIGEPFEARPGRWVGAKVGLFAARPDKECGGFADFDWFRVEAPRSSSRNPFPRYHS